MDALVGKILGGELEAMAIKISIEGATPDEITRGLAAASSVFDRHGTTPYRAADARFNVEGWDIGGFKGRIHTEDLELCGVWDEADKAAVQACCVGWNTTQIPESANLELVDFLRL